MDNRMMVVAAHIGDFTWRCGGSIAKYTAEGGKVKLIVMSDGIRGESNDYWSTEGANIDEGKKRRKDEGLHAADILGVTDIELWNMEDYPLEFTRMHIELLAHKFREFRPHFIVTHDTYDAHNPDHTLVYETVRKAYAVSTGAGFQDECRITPRQIPFFGFEPHYTEVSRFLPGIYIDITESFETKCRAMKAYESQHNMYVQYVRKAELRGQEVRARGDRKGCQYAEAFSTFQAITATGRFTW